MSDGLAASEEEAVAARVERALEEEEPALAPEVGSWRRGSIYRTGGAEDITRTFQLEGLLSLQLVGSPYRRPKKWTAEVHLGWFWSHSATLGDPEHVYESEREARKAAIRIAGEVLVRAMRRLHELAGEEP